MNGTVGTEKEITDIVEQMSRGIDSRFPNTKVIASLGKHSIFVIII